MLCISCILESTECAISSVFYTYYYDPLQSSREHGCVEYRTLHLKECTAIRLDRGSYSEVAETTSNQPKEPPTKKRKVYKLL